MLIRRALTLLVLLALVAPPARAQHVPTDTLDIVSAKPGVETRLRLINLGASVEVMSGGRSLPVRADTLNIVTPARLILPASVFSLAVSTVTPEPGVQTVIMSRVKSIPGNPLFATTLYSPFTLRRDTTGADLRMIATRAASFRQAP